MDSALAESAQVPAELAEILRAEVASCYQCGKCSASCPVASAMETLPHQIVALARLAEVGELVRGESLWLCVGCGTCRSRCPNGIDVGRVIDLLRQRSPQQVAVPAGKDIEQFHRIFVDEIRRRGRIYELGLVLRYKAASRKLWTDLPLAFRLMGRRKLRLSPPRLCGWNRSRRDLFSA